MAVADEEVQMLHNPGHLSRSPAQPHLAALEQVLNLWSLTSTMSFYVSINYMHLFLDKNIMFY